MNSQQRSEEANGCATIRFAGSIKQFAKMKDVQIPKNKIELKTPIRLEDAITQIEEEFSLTVPRHSILVLVNGVESAVIGGLEATLSEGDVVVLVPMFHGG